MGNILSGPQPGQEVERLRQQGDFHAQQRNHCYELSKAAYHAGNHADAKRYSQQGKSHDAKCKTFHRDAAEKAFDMNNKQRGPDEVDLHGLRVKEAVTKAEQCIRTARQQKRRHMVFVVGRGLHSADGVSKLKPAINRLVNDYNLRCTNNKPTQGCIYVELVRPEERGWVESIITGLCVIC